MVTRDSTSMACAPVPDGVHGVAVGDQGEVEGEEEVVDEDEARQISCSLPSVKVSLLRLAIRASILRWPSRQSLPSTDLSPDFLLNPVINKMTILYNSLIMSLKV